MWSIPLYGPLAIHSYGVALCCGVALGVWLASRHIWCREIIGAPLFIDAITYAGLWGIVGSRLWHVVTEWHLYRSWLDVFKIWEGGLSVLGAVVAILIFLPWYCSRHNIPTVLMLDLCGLYAPLVHAIARVGCWSAGCCSGIMAFGGWVHPTQLYSSLCFMLGFVWIRTLARSYRSGSVLAAYLVVVGLERFMVDWWRSDRIFIEGWPEFLSVHQVVALVLFVVGLGILHTIHNQRSTYEHISGS